RHEPQKRRDAVTKIDEALALPLLSARPIDLEHAQARRHLRLALGEGVEACSEDDVLADAAPCLLGDEVLDEASARDDRRPNAPRPLRIHVLPVAPAVLRQRQLETDLVLEYVRRRIELNVHGAP